MSDQMLMYALKGDSTGATAAFKDVGAAIQRTEDRTDKLSTKMEQLQGSVQRAVANSSKLSQASERAVQGMGALSREVPGLVGRMGDLSGATTMVVGAFATMGAMHVMAWVKNAAAASLEYGASLQDMSDRLGITTTDLQIFGNWAEMSGTDTETLAKAIAKLEVKLADGDRTLAKFGITATNGRDAFLQVVAAVEKAPTHFDKAKIASEAFGKSWAEIMPVLDAGSENLSEMAQSAALISPESVENLAKLDDRMAQLAGTTRVFMAEALAAFGPVTMQLIEGMAVEIKKLNDYMTKESKDAFLSRVGGKQVGGSWVMGSDIDLKKMSSKDLNRLIEVRYDGDQNKDVIFSQQDDRYKRMSSLLSVKVAEEKVAAEKKAKEDREKERQTEQSRKAESEQKARESQEEREIDFQRRLFDEIAILTASDDQRDLLRIKLKYENLRDEHANYVDSLRLIDEQYDAEIQASSMKKNFAALATQRDADQEEAEQIDSSGKRRFQSGWGSNDRARLARKMQNAGLIEENGVGVYDATQMSIEEMQEALDNYRAAIDPALSASNQAAAEMGSAWSGVTDSIAGDMASRVVGALSEMRKGTMDLSDVIGGALVGSLDSALNKVLELGIQYALMAGFTALTGGAGAAVAGGGAAAGGGGLGLVDFILKGLSGHADGTLSSPGGLKFLGERGTEAFETPYGQRGVATYGLYQVPAGTRVTPAGSPSSPSEKHYHLHTTESDPVQVVAVFERMVEQKILERESTAYRSRS